MPYEIKENVYDNLMEIKLTGSFTLEELKEKRDAVIAAYENSGIGKLLYDCTDLDNLPDPSTMFEYMEKYPEQLLQSVYTRPGQSIMDLEFAAVIAQNQHKSVKIFSSRESAMAWLDSAKVKVA